MDLPPLYQGVLTEPEVRALGQDVAALGEHVEVLPKRGARAYTTTAAPGLDEAIEALVQRDLYGLQLRYVHDGAGWSDTLLPTDEGFRLVRMRHEL